MTHASLFHPSQYLSTLLSSFFAKAGPTVIMHDETSWSSSEEWLSCSLRFQVVRKGDRNPTFLLCLGVTTSQSSSSLRSGSPHILSPSGLLTATNPRSISSESSGMTRTSVSRGSISSTCIETGCSAPNLIDTILVVAFFSSSLSINAFVRRPSCTSSLN